MNFYYLVCEQGDGFKFIAPGALFSSLKEAQEFRDRYRIALYKSVEIKSTSISIENIIIALLKSEMKDSVELREMVLPNPNVGDE